MTIMLSKRRGFLFGAGSLLMAPAIVRASSLMPVSVLKPEINHFLTARCYVSGPEIDGITLAVGDVILPAFQKDVEAIPGSGFYVVTSTFKLPPGEPERSLCLGASEGQPTMLAGPIVFSSDRAGEEPSS